MFALNAGRILQVNVDARVFNQQFINVLYYKYSSPSGADTGGNSIDFLDSFVADWRANILPQMYADYAVERYWLRGIAGAAPIGTAPNVRWRTTYSFFDLDYRLGDAVLDKGSLVKDVAKPWLPSGTTIRAFKVPNDPVMKYFNKDYNRFGPFTSNELDVDTGDHDKLTTAFAGTFQTAVDDMYGDAIFDVDPPAGNGWYHALWSPAYYGAFVFGTANPVYTAAIYARTGRVPLYVGTQASRRIQPTGLIRGS